MNEMQRILVEDHIHGLEHEAAALRAERARDPDSRRVRLGHWLVGIGIAIAGEIETVRGSGELPCNDGPSPLSPAA